MYYNQESNGRTARRGAGFGVALLASLCLAGCTTTSTAARDDWQTKSTAPGLAKAMELNGFMPRTLDCRFDNTTPGSQTYGSRFTWKPTPRNRRWEWEVGNQAYLASDQIRLQRKGLHRVSRKIVRDPGSGQTIECAIWSN
ncbi:hypothetical protein ACVDG8_005210 [Mesorhizobium sp. ORM8.1]